MEGLRRVEKQLAREAWEEAAREDDGLSRERELMAEVRRLKARVADREAGVESITATATEGMAKAQPVLDAAAAWYETQLHTPLAPKMKARTALILAIKDYKATS